MKELRPRKDSERGAIIVLFMISLVVLLTITGFAVDLGVAYLNRGEISKAVDAASLAGARNTNLGDAAMQELVEQIAAANLTGSGVNITAESLSVAITRPSADTVRVNVTGSAESQGFFGGVLGNDSVQVVSSAEATRYPLDMSLVLDLSGSLARNHAFDDMQEAAKSFLTYFDERIDQFGIVTYSTRALEQMSLRKDFLSPGTQIIDRLYAIADTNIEEGLRVAKAQMDQAANRPDASKIVVLFTDGRPTAFADNLWMDGAINICGIVDCTDSTSGPLSCYGSVPGTGHPKGNGSSAGTWPNTGAVDTDLDGKPDCYAGVAATYVSGNSFRGIFDVLTGSKVVGFSSGGGISYAGNTSRYASPRPKALPNGDDVNGVNIRAFAAAESEAWAHRIRAAGYTIYTVALGNPNAAIPEDAPDLDFLRRIANDKGIVSRSQPRGAMMFAPTPAQLSATFKQLADRVLVRLTR